MKKVIGLIIFAMMIVLPMTVNAATHAYPYECGPDIKLDEKIDGKYDYSKTCTYSMELTNMSLNTFGANFTFDTSIIKVGSVTASDPWSVTNNVSSSTGAAITFSASSSVSNTTSQIATVVFYIDKSDSTKDCTIQYQPCHDEEGNYVCKEKITITPTYTCKIVDGKYYGKNGNEVSKEQYESECVPIVPTGNFLPYAAIATGIALAVIVFTVSRKKNKIYKI